MQNSTCTAKTFGVYLLNKTLTAMNAYCTKSIEELHKLQKEIMDNPLNLNPDKNSIWIYNKKANKKLNDIAWAITYHLAEKKKLSL